MTESEKAEGRCGWCGTTDPLYIAYHDSEWGVPEYDARALWEKLVLDGFQAGLAWITILRKREGMREAFDGFDPAQDLAWMAEVAEESTHVWSGQPRIALFLAAMRHFAEALRTAGRPLDYRRLDEPGNRGTLAAELAAAIGRHRPQRLVMTAPGDWRVLQALRGVAEAAGLPLDVREDRHFFATVRDFAAHAKGRRQLRLDQRQPLGDLLRRHPLRHIPQHLGLTIGQRRRIRFR